MGEHFAPISKDRYAELLAAEAALTAAEAARDEAQQITESWYRQYQATSALLAATEAERDDAREHIKLLEAVTRSDETLNGLQAFNTQLQHANASLVRARKVAEQRAARLAALEQATRHLVACDRGDGVHAADWEQFEAAVAALGAAEAERDKVAWNYARALEREVGERELRVECQERLTAAEAERDRLAHELADERRKMHVYAPDNQVTHCGCRLCGERQAQGSRLAALETAARAWALVFMDAPAQEPWWSAWYALQTAVHALAAPPGDE